MGLITPFLDAHIMLTGLLLAAIAPVYLPPAPEPIALESPAIGQTLTNPANPRINKLADLQQAAFVHAKRELRLARSSRVTIERFQGSQEWGAAIVFVQDRGQQMGYQVTIVMEWANDRWAYRGMIDGASAEDMMSVGMPAESAYWTARFLAENY